MMNMQRNFAAWLLACLASLWLAAAAAETNSDTERLDKIFQRSSLKIATPDARLHSFDVWLADDDEHRQLGLMYVRKLAPDAGMLFVYPNSFKVGMWMKNTLISLDMLFVDANGKVLQVVERTIPQSLKTITATSEVLGVIELNAGTAERLRIRPGSRVMHPAFGGTELASGSKGR
jgi:uncharacterized membrane protein (UPF0127 family)